MGVTRTIDDFTRAGYREWPTPIGRHALCMLQKRVRDEDGRTRYFVNVYPYAHENRTMSFEGEIQYYKGDDTFSVTILCVTSPEHVEGWAAEFWQRMEMDHEEKVYG